MKTIQLRSALRAAHRGWPVFPVYGVTNDGRCACGKSNCENPGKHPMTPHGYQDATTDEKAIRGWWKQNPTANVGIVTGGPDRPIVVDIDPQRGGLLSLAEFEKKHVQLPDGPELRTGGGGFHLYFDDQDGTVRNRVDFLPGVDVRGIGGYVVGAGSRHKFGKRYVWLNGKTPEQVALPTLPAQLRQLIEAKPKSATQLQTELMIPEGKRNATLTSLAGTMRKRGMTAQAIEAALLVDNQKRCKPPLSENEVAAIAHSVAKYAAGDADDEEIETDESELKFRTGKQIQNDMPPEIPWIAQPYVALEAITEIDGKAKLAGKTTFVTSFARSVLHGSSFLGKPTTKSKITYLTEQSPVSFRATMKETGLLGEKDFNVLFWSETVGIPWGKVIEAAIKECKRTGAKLLIVDTLAQFAGLAGDTENNAGDALKALRPLQKAAREGIAVVIVRHERKSGGKLGDSARGSSAFAGAVDVIVSIRRPDGNPPRNVRLLQAISRFGIPDDLLIELSDDGYRALGAPGEAANAQAAQNLLLAMPSSKKKAAKIEDLVNITNKSRAKVQRLLDVLLETGEITRLGKGRKGDPLRFYKT